MKSQTATVEVRMEEGDRTGSPGGFTFRGKYLRYRCGQARRN